MNERASLRSTMVAVTIIVTVLALLVSAALILLTTALYRATESSGASVENVRLAQEAEIDLLLHQRARDALVKRSVEGDLRRRLQDARRYVTTDEEERILSEATQRVEEYLSSARDPRRSTRDVAALQVTAFGALESLVNVNVAQARESQRVAARWDRAGNVLGVGVGAVVLLVGAAVIVWLRGAFAPILALAEAMARFGRGEREVRAVERGPRELRDMSVRFNEMATAIAAQRHAQMAFLGGVAHDLRNPLSALKLSVSMLGPDTRLPSEDRIRQTVARLGRQIGRMDRMLGDFIDMAKIEAGLLELRLDTHDARVLVEEAVELFEGSGPLHPLEVHLPPHALPVRCDPLRIEQVMINLISNAIKYSPSGGSIEVSVEARDRDLVFSVRDHGIGIAAEERERVFEPFRRLGLSEETVPGVGLGLFVVRKIVDAHGGRIEIESSPGAGSTFRVLLPAAPLSLPPVVRRSDDPPEWSN